MFNLSIVQLRFTCEAVTPIRLNGYNAGRQTPTPGGPPAHGAGNGHASVGAQLRGALGNVMRRAYCGHAPHPSPYQGEGSRGEGCPVCWLLAANEHPGEERRGYALVPPRVWSSLRGVLPSDEAIPMLPEEIASRSFDSNSQKARVSAQDALAMTYQPGQRFDFGLTLFGSALRFLPYFILAVPEMGHNGVGAGRGQFVLRSVRAIDPLEGNDQIVLAEGESLVRVPDRLITPDRVQQAADRTLTSNPSPCEGEGDVQRRVRVNFLTPMRLIDNERLVKAPDFGVLFKRLLERLDELNQQFGEGERRAAPEVQGLQTLANQVRLIEAQTQWIELQSGSSRSGKSTWLSGFVGSAVYAAPFGVWRAVLPWLLWGSIAQVGKDVVKGNGVFEIAESGKPLTADRYLLPARKDYS